MPLVYRVENEQGRGPFYSTGFNWFPREAATRIKAPSDDNIEGLAAALFSCSEDLRFAGYSLEDIWEWFRPDLDGLEEHGYFLSCYEAQEILKGQTQVVFFLSKSRLVWQVKCCRPELCRLLQEVRREHCTR